MSGEVVNNMVSKFRNKKFSKAGTMTVTIRPKEGAEVSKLLSLWRFGGTMWKWNKKSGMSSAMMAIPQMATTVAILVAKKTEHSIFRPLISWLKGIITDFSQNLLNIAFADLLTRYDAIRAAANARGGY